MLGFLSAVLLTYGAMHLYALGKEWLALPHTPALATALLSWAVLMMFAPPEITLIRIEHGEVPAAELH